MKITYQLQVEPFEAVEFGRAVVKTVRDETLEFSLDDLTSEQKAKIAAGLPSPVSDFGGSSFVLKVPQYHPPATGRKSPLITWETQVFESELNLTEALASLFEAAKQYEEYKGRKAEADAQIRAEARRKAQEEAEAKAQAEARRKAQEEAALAAAAHLDFRATGGADDLQERLFTLSGLKRDTRFNSWVKRVDRINTAKKGGYSLEGEFIAAGTQYVPDEYAVFVVASTTGSRKNNSTDFRVVVQEKGGHFRLTDIRESNEQPGWATRLHQPVNALLESAKPAEGEGEDDRIARIVKILSDSGKEGEELAQWLKGRLSD